MIIVIYIIKIVFLVSGGIPPFPVSEIHKYLKKVDGWDVKKKEYEIYYLRKKLYFQKFFSKSKIC